MIDDAFVAQAAAQVTVRPRKLGYLIQAGRADMFRSAARYAFTEWGGVGQPIVAVMRKEAIHPGAWQFLDVLKPEVIIDYVGVGDQLRSEITARLGADVVLWRHISHDEPGVHTLVSVPPGSLRARTIFELPPGARMAEEVAIGQIPTDPDNLRLWEETGGVRRMIATPEDFVDAQTNVPSPVWMTKQQYRTYRSQLLGAPVIIFTEHHPSLNRLIFFWNVRALGASSEVHVLWIPLRLLTADGITERIRTLCRSKIPTVPDLILLGPDGRAMDRAARKLGLVRDKGRRGSVTLQSRLTEPRKSPLAYWRGIDPRGFILDPRWEGTRAPVPATVTRPVTNLQFQSPVTFNPSIGGKIRLEIDGIDALRWPRRPQVAKLIEPNATFTDGGLSLLHSPSNTYRLTLRVPDAPTVLDTALGEAGWTWSLSDKGRYASALLGVVEGRISIPTLHDGLCLLVVRELSSLSSKKAGQLLASFLADSLGEDQIQAAVRSAAPALAPRWLTSGEIASAISRRGDSVRREQVVAVLSNLLADRLVRRGFRYRCKICNLTTNLLLGDVSDNVRCEGCDSQGVLLGPEGEPELVYTLNSLADRASDQDCIGHLPVQDWMRQHLSMIWAVPGADLASASGVLREIDVLGLSRDEVLIAEVKTTGAAFTDAVVQDNLDLARDLGADRLVLASLDNLREARRQEIQAMAAVRGATVAVIGLAELREQA